MNLSFHLSNIKSHPIIVVVLSVVLVFLPGCAARRAQQEIDTVKEHAIAIQKAFEFIRFERLERNSKCRGSGATFAKLNLPPLETDYRSSGPNPPDSQLRPVLDYIRHAYILKRYMDEKKVTVETALAAMGDLVLPPVLAPEIDPFNGCMLLLSNPLDKPFTYQGGKIGDSFVFYWQSKDWRESRHAALKILEKFLPHEKRTPFDHFLLDYAFTLNNTLMTRAETGEITLLQWLKAGNAGSEYLFEQAKQYVTQLRTNLVRAKAQDKALLRGVATGLGVVATTALAVSTVDANYRIANAQRFQALQAQRPIQCHYRLPDRYGSPGYINCR